MLGVTEVDRILAHWQASEFDRRWARTRTILASVLCTQKTDICWCSQNARSCTSSWYTHAVVTWCTVRCFSILCTGWRHCFAVGCTAQIMVALDLVCATYVGDPVDVTVHRPVSWFTQFWFQLMGWCVWCALLCHGLICPVNNANMFVRYQLSSGEFIHS